MGPQLQGEYDSMKSVRAMHMVLLLLGLMYFITYLDRVNVSTAAAGFSKDFGLNKAEIGLVFSAFAYPYLVFQIIGGWLSDRVGARRTLIACGVIWASATILSGMAPGLLSLLLARVLLGFGEGATFPAATTAMSRWVPKAERGYAHSATAQRRGTVRARRVLHGKGAGPHLRRSKSHRRPHLLLLRPQEDA